MALLATNALALLAAGALALLRSLRLASLLRPRGLLTGLLPAGLCFALGAARLAIRRLVACLDFALARAVRFPALRLAAAPLPVACRSLPFRLSGTLALLPADLLSAALCSAISCARLGALLLALGAWLRSTVALFARLLLALLIRAAFLSLSLVPLLALRFATLSFPASSFLSSALAIFATLFAAMLEDALHRFAVVGAVGGDCLAPGIATLPLLAATLLPRIAVGLPAPALAGVATSGISTRVAFAGLPLPACLIAARLRFARLLLPSALALALRTEPLPLLGSLPLVLTLTLLIARLLALLLLLLVALLRTAGLAVLLALLVFVGRLFLLGRVLSLLGAAILRRVRGALP